MKKTEQFNKGLQIFTLRAITLSFLLSLLLLLGNSTMAQVTVSNFSPSSGCGGLTPVVITGTNFTGATIVTFGGTNAQSFIVNSPTQITAIPAFGNTGTISVTSPFGTGTSVAIFTFNPSFPSPNPVTATPSTICQGSTTQLNSTSAPNDLQYWYTVPTGGVTIGSSLSGANFPVTPPVTTTYYVENGGPAGPAGTQTFNYTGAVQNFTVPPGITSITIDARGAQGGTSGAAGGLGAKMVGDFTVTPGQVLSVWVGQQGIASQNAGGGGGGSGVIDGAIALIIAGGGGGASVTGEAGKPGLTGATGGSSSGAGGAAGNGGEKGFMTGDCGWAAGGGGFLTDGYGGDGSWDGGPLPGTLGGPAAGKSSLNGGAGGIGGSCGFSPLGAGGWGCGGGARAEYGGGGGGGYSGGGGGQYTAPVGQQSGGGGGSINGGINQNNTAGFQSGDGQVIITWQGASGCPSPRVPVTVTVNPAAIIATASPAIICPGGSSVLSATGAISYLWNPGGLVGSPTVSPVVTTTYTVTGTNALGCSASSTVTVTVTGAPVILATATPASICLGSSSVLSATGGATYLWNPGGLVGSPTVSPVATTTYTVTGTVGGGCFGTTVVTVVVNPVAALPNPVTATPSIVCAGATSLLNSTSAPNEMQFWYTVPNGGVAIGSSLSGANFSVAPVVTTTYYVENGGLGGPPGTQTFNYTGAVQTFTVPIGVTSIDIEAFGSEGTGLNGFLPGKGGKAKGTLTVTPGQVLNIMVGGTNGFNGGGIGLGGAHGGGASDVRVSPYTINDRVIVAGGGGGAGGDNWQCLVGTGDGGGGVAVGTNFVGGAGGAGYTSGTGCGTNGGNAGGIGGNGTHGGGGGGGGLIGGGTGAVASGFPAQTGSLGQGGDSYNAPGCQNTGAGGGGYYGGGGAAGNNCGAGRGGGGSSWTGTLTSPSFQAGVQTGNGKITLTWAGPTACPSARVPVTVTVNPAPALTATASPDSICAGASSVLVGGGANSYVWNPGGMVGNPIVTPAVTTTYTVTGTNGNGCTTTATVTVTVSTLPIITATASPSVICVGASSVLTGSGAATYSWSPGGYVGSPTVSPLATTTYTVTGSAGASCSATAVVTVTVYATPTVSGSASPDPICIGGSTVLTGSGAASYLWNPGGLVGTPTVNPPVTTTYTVIGTVPGGCSDTSTVTVTVNNFITVNASAQPSTICIGGSSVLSASGGASYTWDPGGLFGSPTVSPIVTTTYTVTGSNGAGCTGTSVVTVTVLDPNPIISNSGGVLSVLNGPYSTYQWYFNGNPIAGATNPTYNVMQNGTYEVEVTINNCPKRSPKVILTGVGINDVESQLYSISPNPTSDKVTIGGVLPAVIKIINMQGQVIKEARNTNEISLANLSNGMYFIKLYDEKGRLLLNQKITKQ